MKSLIDDFLVLGNGSGSIENEAPSFCLGVMMRHVKQTYRGGFLV